MPLSTTLAYDMPMTWPVTERYFPTTDLLGDVAAAQEQR
jgi:hypothetical protein